jgi:hypothetical protein
MPSATPATATSNPTTVASQAPGCRLNKLHAARINARPQIPSTTAAGMIRGSVNVADPSGRRNPRCTNEATRNVSAMAPTNAPNPRMASARTFHRK